MASHLALRKRSLPAVDTVTGLDLRDSLVGGMQMLLGKGNLTAAIALPHAIDRQALQMPAVLVSACRAWQHHGGIQVFVEIDVQRRFAHRATSPCKGVPLSARVVERKRRGVRRPKISVGSANEFAPAIGRLAGNA
jgi:hypothetical protein